MRSILIFLLSLLGSAFAYSQTAYFRNYSVEHGLPFIQVQTIFQDNKGYLWTGGYGGLSRFDGNNFRNFSPRNGLVNHAVTCINQDPSGNLWIGTINGLSLYDGTAFRNFTVKDGLPDNFITYINADSASAIWIGTMKGITRFDGKSFRNFNKSTGLPTNTVYVAHRDRKGWFWLGSDIGLLIFDGKGISPVKIGSNEKQNQVSSVVSTDEGKIYCGTGDGLFVYDQKLGVASAFRYETFGGKKINALVHDRKGIVWVGTESGLYRIINGKIKPYPLRDGINSNYISSLFIDYEGNLWVGTYNGMYRYRDDQFVTYSESSGMKSSFVFQICRDAKQNLWVATTQGLHINDGNSFKVLTEKNGLMSSSVMSCFRDNSNNMWVGTSKGLNIFKGNRIESYSTAHGLVSDSVCSIMQDSKGRIILGGQKGISVFENGKFKAYPFSSTYAPDFSVWSIIESGENRYILGTYQGGLFEFDNGKIECINKRIGIEENVVLDIKADSDGILYFATFDGVFMYIPEHYPNKNVKRLVHFNEADGMSSDLVYCIGFDKSGKYLWAGTNQGVNRIDIASYKKAGKKRIDVYGKEDGFFGVESNTNGIFSDEDGSIWFGTVNGLIKYNPYEYIPNIIEPRIDLTGLRLFYKDTTFTEGLDLPHDQNHLSFRFAATSLTNPSKVRYRILLDGFDKNWSPPTATPTATYSNLPPGNYTFKVLAANNEGLWTSSPSAYSFKIRKPWWNTWWFRGSAVLIIAAIIFAGFRIRSQQIRRKERDKAKRNVEVARLELKALRAQMNPHFIFNSLNSIQHFILEREETSAVKYLNKFAKLIRIILNNSEKPSITLREELEALQLYLELEQLRFSDKFTFEIHIGEGVDIDYHEVPPLILQPYVENAILHGLNPRPEKGALEIFIRKDSSYIICTVKDNGIGRKNALEIRGERLKGRISHGTRITRERLELLNRSFHSELSVNITDLETPAGEASGTKVDVFIPA